MLKSVKDERVLAEVRDYIRDGSYPETACWVAGADYKEVETAIQRYDKGEATKEQEKIAIGIKQALAELQLNHTRNVKYAADAGDVKASMWTLKNMFPEKYNRQEVSDGDVNTDFNINLKIIKSEHKSLLDEDE